MQYNDLLLGLKSLLGYHHSAGIDPYPRNEGITKFLESAPSLPGVVSPPGIPEQSAPAEVVGKEQRIEQNSTRVPVVTLAEIAEEVASCRACNLAQCRFATRAGRGPGSGVRLLVVGNWLTGKPDGAIPEEVQFGIEEDQMLSRMLTAINIPKEQTFITNAIKCVVPEDVQPLAENFRICLSFLHRQISLIDPDCICTMGMMSTRALLGLPQPLSQLRGRFLSFQADRGRQIPVMATYHPSFLLQNPEMKKAVWLDLQSIGRQLKTLS